MRMTNKIMRNNSLYNINQNKLLEDKLTNQMTSQSKINRPSDDPVVAIRALRLRSNVTSVSQYYDKNAPDAEQWLNITADALKSVDEILTDLYTKATDSSNKKWTSDDLEILVTEMKSLTQEFYSSGNVDYAGRFIFSGYRTDTPITFTAENEADMEVHPVTYKITEKTDYSKIDTIQYTNYICLTDPTVPDNAKNETNVRNNELYRIRLSYDDLDEMDAGGSKLTLKDKNGADITVKEYPSAETAYQMVGDGTEPDVAFIPSTGELIFSKQYYKTNFAEGDTFTITYEKTDWKEGDINPVHYFPCEEIKETEPGVKTTTLYNQDEEDQDIYYDVGFDQKIQVNTRASEVFTHDVQRDLDDFSLYLEQLKGIETTISDIEKKMKDVSEDSADYKKLQQQLDAANKADTFIRENLHDKFQNQITRYQNYLDANNVAVTGNATRGSRLELIGSRLMSQKATFKELQTDNEGIDISEIAVELSSADLTYQAALMATGKIMQTNLMNYI